MTVGTGGSAAMPGTGITDAGTITGIAETRS